MRTVSRLSESISSSTIAEKAKPPHRLITPMMEVYRCKRDGQGVCWVCGCVCLSC